MGYPEMLAVGIDVDGVLGEQVIHVLTKLQSEGKAQGLTKEMINEWDYSLGSRTITDEIEESLLNDQFVSEMPVVHDSFDSMEELYQKHHIVIATSRPLETEQATLRWLRKHFKYHEYVNTRTVGKGNFGLDLLVDDSIQNIEQFASAGRKCILFSQPWNREETQAVKDFIRSRQILRCENWKEVLDNIEKVAEGPRSN